MRTMRVVSLILITTAALVSPPATAATTAPAAPARTLMGPTLVGIRAAHHPTYDRIVFDFQGGKPQVRSVGYVSSLTHDPSDLPVRIAGRAILKVVFTANAHDEAGTPTAPDRITFALPNIMTAVNAGDFEAVTSYGIGLASRQPYRLFTLTNPDRVVIDVNAAFRTVNRRVYFFNEPNFAVGREPYFTPVLRPVLPMTPATGVMDRLFAGPTPAEYAAGLRLLRSEATGFTALSISGDGIARVRLVGGCDSLGSTATIAGEIGPTLHQFTTVDHVKIYDPFGHTEQPTGHVDSIPVCLEP